MIGLAVVDDIIYVLTKNAVRVRISFFPAAFPGPIIGSVGERPTSSDPSLGMPRLGSR